MGVFGDLAIDFEGESEGGAAGFGGDARLCAGSDGGEEVFEFEAQRLGAGWVELGEGEAGGWVGGGYPRG